MTKTVYTFNHIQRKRLLNAVCNQVKARPELDIYCADVRFRYRNHQLIALAKKLDVDICSVIEDPSFNPVRKKRITEACDKPVWTISITSPSNYKWTFKHHCENPAEALSLTSQAILPA